MDAFVSPTFFPDRFIGTFGKVAYYLEKIGTWFAVFLVLKLLLDIVISFLKALEIHRLTGATVGFGKILLGATYNLFVLSIFTSMFARQTSNSLQDTNSQSHAPVPQTKGPVTEQSAEPARNSPKTCDTFYPQLPQTQIETPLTP